MDWRRLLTKQSDTWPEHKLPEPTEDAREYARQYDRLNHYKPVRYEWDHQPKGKK